MQPLTLAPFPPDRRDELGKRAVIFNLSSAIATMFSGYLMTAVINLDGRNGLKGWQWQVKMVPFGNRTCGALC